MSKEMIQLIVLLIAGACVFGVCWWIKHATDVQNRQLEEQRIKDEQALRKYLEDCKTDRANAAAAGIEKPDFARTVGQAIGKVINEVGEEANKYFDQKVEEEKKFK